MRRGSTTDDELAGGRRTSEGPAVPSSRLANWYGAALACLLGGQAALLTWAAITHSPNANEPAHLAAGISHWELRSFELYSVNPPLVRLVASVPAMLVGVHTDWTNLRANRARPEFLVGPDLIAANGRRSLLLTTLGRCACVPFILTGGYVCFSWARRLYGPAAGIIATTLWCFCPLILGHGSCLTPDAHATAVGLGANFLFWRWLCRPGWARMLGASIGLGAALLAKSTWLILLVMWPTGAAVWFGLANDCKGGVLMFVRHAIQIGLMVMIGLYVVNSAYLYSGSCVPLGEYQFCSRMLGGRSDGHVGNRFNTGVWTSLPVPLPRDYVIGVDLQKRDVERRLPSYFRGRVLNGGLWYYYVYALGVKVPMGTWILAAMALAYRLGRQRAGNERLRHDVYLLVAFVSLIVVVSTQVDYTAHVRYAMPALPYLYVWTGQLGTAAAAFRPWRLPVVGALVATTISSLSVAPHWISYFNEAAGGSARGHLQLANSNLDWGQDLLYLQKWRQAHPEVTRVRLAYYGMFHPGAIGMVFDDVPELPQLATRIDARTSPRDSKATGGLEPGCYAISVNFVLGHPFWVPRADGSRIWQSEAVFKYFQELHPITTAGYSIWIYDVTEAEASRIRALAKRSWQKGSVKELADGSGG